MFLGVFFFLLLEIFYIEYLIWLYLYIFKVSNWKSLNKKVFCIKKKDMYSNYLINFKGEVKGIWMFLMICIRFICFRLC